MRRMRRQMWREKAAAEPCAVPHVAANAAETHSTSEQSQEPFLDTSSQDCSGTSTTATMEPQVMLYQSGTRQDASADSSAADAQQQSADAAAAKAAVGSSVFQSEQ